jgi:hypothetical protein
MLVTSKGMFLLVFLALNALFWGLFPHAYHCALVTTLAPGITCPAHWIHLTMGLVSYLAAIYVSQRDYIKFFL